ncbi:MAG: aspartate/glutamate racemase family protein [Chloroflexi bacterium]|nr:aspartate/glutamate racemase family protein [Chloroflexota bacterium]
MYGWRGKIGLLVPSTNTVMEGDFHRLAPEGLSVHTGRVRLADPNVSPESLAEMATWIDAAAHDVATCGVEVIVYGCTSGSFFRGVAWDEEVSTRVRRQTGRPFVTTSSAMGEALRRLKIRRVAVATPYPDEINRRLERYLVEADFEVTGLRTLGDPNTLRRPSLPPFVFYQLAREVGRGDCDGVFISCTNVRAIDIIERLEQDLGKPVVTANQASFWAALRRLGLPDAIAGFGALLRTQ